MRNCIRNKSGFSLIETMTVIVVLGIVLSLLFAYQDQGWKLFYQSYGRGLSQAKAKLAIRLITDELREANKNRIATGRGFQYGIPFPDDGIDNSPYIYFTKPILYETTGDVIGYNYFLYYFAKPKKNTTLNVAILKSVKFLNQSKFYTEDSEKIWPFLPPLIELQKSKLPEDDIFIESLNQPEEEEEDQIQDTIMQGREFLDHFAQIAKDKKSIPVSGNFTAQLLTDPFTKENLNISFGQDYKKDETIKIKVSIEEPPIWFGLMSSTSEFEVSITPRN